MDFVTFSIVEQDLDGLCNVHANAQGHHPETDKNPAENTDYLNLEVGQTGQSEGSSPGFHAQSGEHQTEWNGPSDTELSAMLQPPNNKEQGGLATLLSTAISASKNRLNDTPITTPVPGPVIAGVTQEAEAQTKQNIGALISALNSVIENSKVGAKRPRGTAQSDNRQEAESDEQGVSESSSDNDEDYHPSDDENNSDDENEGNNRNKPASKKVPANKNSDANNDAGGEKDSDEDSDDPVRCNICRKTFGNQDGLRRHKARTHKPESMNDITCEICGAKFQNRQNLRRHMNNVHNGVPVASCSLCDASFTTARSLSLHINKAHHDCPESEGGPKKKRKRNTNKVHNCSLCSYSSPQKYNVKRHFNIVHINSVQLPCPFSCGRVCRSQANLKTHAMTCKKRPREN